MFVHCSRSCWWNHSWIATVTASCLRSLRCTNSLSEHVDIIVPFCVSLADFCTVVPMSYPVSNVANIYFNIRCSLETSGFKRCLHLFSTRIVLRVACGLRPTLDSRLILRSTIVLLCNISVLDTRRQTSPIVWK